MNLKSISIAADLLCLAAIIVYKLTDNEIVEWLCLIIWALRLLSKICRLSTKKKSS